MVRSAISFSRFMDSTDSRSILPRITSQFAIRMANPEKPYSRVRTKRVPLAVLSHS
ncbi:hypothetical protein D3C84_1305570 [compost metagenome]